MVTKSIEAETQPAPLSQKEFELLADFRYALRQFLHLSETAASCEGLTPQQHQGLIAIRGFPGTDPITVGELAERLQLRHHTAVMLANRLVSLELIERRSPPNGGDRRQIYLVLTERGNEIINKMSTVYRLELLRLQPGLTDLCASLRGQ